MATSRRTPRSAQRQRPWGNSVAVLTGDFLFARASHILADLAPRPYASRPRRSSGWSPARSWRPRPARRPRPGRPLPGRAQRQDRLAGRRRRPVRRADGRGRRADRGHPHVRERLGIAFQLADDVLDTPPPTRVRQDPRTDLREGIPIPSPSCGCGPGPRRTAGPRTWPWSSCSTATWPTTPPGRGAAPACCAPTRRWSRPARTPSATPRRRAPRWRRCPRGTRSRRWRSCATRWSTARAEPSVHRAGERPGARPRALPLLDGR